MLEEISELLWVPNSTVWRSAALVQWLVTGDGGAKELAMQPQELESAFKIEWGNANSTIVL